MELLNTARESNKYITDYIKIADAKIAGYVTISSAVSALMLPNIQRWLVSQPITGWYQLYFLLFLLAAIIFMGTLLFSLRALSPRVDAADSLVSFPDISKMNTNDYILKFNKLTEQEITDEYLKHNKTLSLIATKKFYYLKCATNCCLAWVPLYLLLFLIQVFTSFPK